MSGQEDTDESLLIARIARQDQEALAQLYDRYAQVLYAAAFKTLGSVEETEEVVLDVFRQVWRQAHSYKTERGRVDTWLFMLTRSRALDRWRVLRRIERAAIASEDAAIIQPLSTLSDPAEDVLVSERRKQVLAALDQLPDQQRHVLEMVYYKGLTHAEIAAQTGQPLGTVKTRIRLGLTKLREALSTQHLGNSM